MSTAILEFLEEALRETRTAVAPLEPMIAVDAVDLPAGGHRDAADRLIVASARYLDAALVTRDGARAGQRAGGLGLRGARQRSDL